jgi:hypothetical protein
MYNNNNNNKGHYATDKAQRGVVIAIFSYQSFFSPIGAKVNCLKNNFKIYIKIDMKIAPTYFGTVTPSSGSALLVLAKVTVVKIAN